MIQCTYNGNFKKKFDANMTALGLPVPSGLFETATTTTATLVAMIESYNALGATATVSEILGATVAVEKLKLIAALAGSFYIGAAIGSLAVATSSSVTCSLSMSEILAFKRKHKLDFNGDHLFYHRHREVFMASHQKRGYYHRAVIQ
ncbi:hypothetical protein C9J03_03875 [Photobacterium gaetbulicola]|uniref:Uncharacterized protein n=1 Tax=Photobacterium gaetbulicola Gung47 TaxID=658445 RepID=A0A0C5WHZ5_9GAMM|nr:hypothetical protein [Photobacterium gaetbulicola]AJR06738.1 hypothetical protein H744_1c1720 [Photobacterium gaetbulicola Gung47]PSU14057.1 hypothetical protein C9J03_03875 [Photobacterium gaetbulicola]